MEEIKIIQNYGNVKQGGIFISDDISDNMSFNFCDDIGKKPSVVKFKNKFQGIILK